jgi:regulator of nucleoside diphosphate kinase
MRRLIVTEADFANLSLLRDQTPLRRALERAIVVASDAVPPEIVTMNSQVVLIDGKTGERRVVSIVYPADADAAAGRISVLEALGTALLGAAPGHALECGLRVEKVIHQPERALRAHMVLRRGGVAPPTAT